MSYFKKQFCVKLSLLLCLCMLFSSTGIGQLLMDDLGTMTVYASSSDYYSSSSSRVEVMPTGNCGENASYELDNDGTLRIWCSDRNNTGVIKQYAFSNDYFSNAVRKVVIENGITEIGWNAFEMCTAITAITIPDSVTIIGDRAFSNCWKLTEITIPDSVTIIGNSAFSNCWKLTEITIPKSVNTIGVGAFLGCRALTEISIPNSVTIISHSTFSNCCKLTKITIPESVTTIGGGAFLNCENLTEIKIPKSVTKIGNKAFSGCKNEKLIIEIPCGVKSLERNILGGLENAIYECISGTVKVVEGSVADIKIREEYADKIEDSTFKLNRTGEHDFLGEDEEVLKNCKLCGAGKCGESAYYMYDETSKTLHIYGSGSLYNNAFNVNSGAATTLNDDEQRALIARNMKKVIIGKDITELAVSAFQGNGVIGDATNSQLEIVEFEEGSKLTVIGIRAFCYCKSLSSFSMPDSVKTIGDYAFSQCENLSSVELSNNLETIGYDAFDLCEKLENVVIPPSVTTIEGSAFENCFNLLSISIANPLVEIGDSSLQGDYNLENVHVSCSFHADHDDVSSYWRMRGVEYTSIVKKDIHDFSEQPYVADEDRIHHNQKCKNCDFLNQENHNFIVNEENETEHICEYCNSVEKHKFIDEDSNPVLQCTVCGTDNTQKCGESVYYAYLDSEDGTTLYIYGYGPMNDYNYAGRTPWFSTTDSKIAKVIIGDGVTSIGNEAFYFCSNLNSIIIPSSVTSIGDYAFGNCSKLTTISIPEGVTSIKSYTFSNCGKLTNVSIPEGVTSIGEYAFKSCYELEEITLPNGLQSIGDQVFANCSSLKKVVVPCSVTDTHNNAFRNALGSLEIVVAPNSKIHEYLVRKNGEKGEGGSILYDWTITTTGTHDFTDDVVKCKICGTCKLYAETGKHKFIDENGVCLTHCKVCDIEAPKCGDSAYYVYDEENKILYVYGSGSLWDYALSYKQWEADEVDSYIKLVIESDITRIGRYCFCSTDISEVTISDSVTEIGDNSFTGNCKLEKIIVPCSVKSIGDSVFRNISGNAVITVVPDSKIHKYILEEKDNNPKWTVNATGSHDFSDNATKCKVCGACKLVVEKGKHNYVDYVCTDCEAVDKFGKYFEPYKELVTVENNEDENQSWLVNEFLNILEPAITDFNITTSMKIIALKPVVVSFSYFFYEDFEATMVVVKNGEVVTQLEQSTPDKRNYEVKLQSGDVLNIVHTRGNGGWDSYPGVVYLSDFDISKVSYYDLLQNAIADAEKINSENCSDLSVGAFQDAIDAAKALTEAASDEEINTAITNITEAKNNLKVATFTVITASNPANSGILNGGGRYAVGEKIVLNAKAVSGYRFASWKQGETEISANTSCEIEVTAAMAGELTYTACYEANENKKLSVNVGNGTVSYSYQNGTQTGTWTNGFTDNTYAKGTYFTITAEPNDTYEFLYWVNGEGRVVSDVVTYSFYLGDDVSLTAHYKTQTDNQKYVIFKDMNGKVLWSGDVTLTEGTGTVALPSHNNFAGYTFDKWVDGNGNVVSETETGSIEIRDAMTIYATYKGKTGLTLVVNGEQRGDTYTYAQSVRVSADEMNGEMHFSGWYKNDVLVSDSLVYEFIITDDTTLVAKYEGVAEIQKQPILNLTVSNREMNETTGRQSFVMNAEWSVPEGYTFMGAGIILTQNAEQQEKLELESVGNNGILKISTKLTTSEGLYSYTLSMGETAQQKDVYMAGYLSYVNNVTGETEVLYTPVKVSNHN